MEKVIVVPFVLVIAIVAILFFALAASAGVGYSGQPSGSSSASGLYVQSALFDDTSLGDSAPCSTAGMTVTCYTSFAVHPSDSISLIVSIRNTGTPQNVTFAGLDRNGIVSLAPSSWIAASGSSQHTITGSSLLSSPQMISDLTITV